MLIVSMAAGLPVCASSRDDEHVDMCGAERATTLPWRSSRFIPTSSSVRARQTSIPGADQFHRSHPAEVELTSDAIRISEQVVDFGCAIIVALNAINPERRIRDL